MPQSLDAALIRRWADAAFAGLGQARSEIDALNVFPVPDGDTGTNMFLTSESAASAVAECFEESAGRELTAAQAMTAFAKGALLGARGNSGVIMSQLLRGVSDVIANSEPGIDAHSDGQIMANALTRAADLAYNAVAVPKEGTVLSVARAAELAAQAAAAVPAATLKAVVESAAAGAQIALDETPEQLQVLKDAGVVDSGGRGLVVLLDALTTAVTGSRRKYEPYRGRVESGPLESHTLNYGGPEYEVMFLLEADDDEVPAMRDKLAALGDSLVVVGGDRLWNVHVHVDDTGAAVEAGVEAGRPYRIKITRLEEAEELRQSGRNGHDVPDKERFGRALVAVAHGTGVAAVLRESGVTVVSAQPGRRPSTKELLDGVIASAGQEVILLPSDGDTRTVAEAAAQQARDMGIRVAVVPTSSVVQTLAAVAVHEPDAHFDDDLVAMGREAGATRYGAVTVAVKEAMTSAGVCRIGDVLGLVDGDIVEIGETIESTAIAILNRMLASGGELVTIVAGAGADEHLINSIASAAERHNDVELEVIDGQQPLWPLIIGVE